MSNYDQDEIERNNRYRSTDGFGRDDQEDIKKLLQRPHPDTNKDVRQWDAQTQSYVIVKEVDECYEDEEVTNPKHYDKVGFAIQPIEYITANELDFLEGNIIKYVSRYPHKGGVNDLLKAKTYIEFLITRERGKE